jgi:hypothetical protein
MGTAPDVLFISITPREKMESQGSGGTAVLFTKKREN